MRFQGPRTCLWKKDPTPRPGRLRKAACLLLQVSGAFWGGRGGPTSTLPGPPNYPNTGRLVPKFRGHSKSWVTQPGTQLIGGACFDDFYVGTYEEAPIQEGELYGVLLFWQAADAGLS